MDDTPITRELALRLPGAALRLSTNPLGQPDLELVLSSDSDNQQTNSQLALRQGAIVPLVVPFSNGSYPLYRLVAEFTISVNTAAIGDNIELLSLPEN